MRKFLHVGIALFALLASSTRAAGLPNECAQLLVGLAPDWNSPAGKLVRFERDGLGRWHLAGEPVAVLFGKNGLAWGRGLAGQDEGGLHKKEHDGRAPAGIFRLGKIYTPDASLPPGADFPFHQISPNDAWIDDPASANYNRLVTIPDRAHSPPWFDKEKMRPNDPAYRWLIEIRHNSDPPAPNEGSAIFFHIRRGLTRPTAGCTTMAQSELVSLVVWLRAAKNPCYALLPRDVYLAKMAAWKLPPEKIFPPEIKF